jgi:hypothetical protein
MVTVLIFHPPFPPGTLDISSESLIPEVSTFILLMRIRMACRKMRTPPRGINTFTKNIGTSRTDGETSPPLKDPQAITPVSQMKKNKKANIKEEVIMLMIAPPLRENFDQRISTVIWDLWSRQ